MHHLCLLGFSGLHIQHAVSLTLTVCFVLPKDRNHNAALFVRGRYYYYKPMKDVDIQHWIYVHITTFHSYTDQHFNETTRCKLGELKCDFKETGLLTAAKVASFGKEKCSFPPVELITFQDALWNRFNRNLPHILIFSEINWLPASWSVSFGPKWRVRQNRRPCQFVPNILAHSAPRPAHFNPLLY